MTPLDTIQFSAPFIENADKNDPDRTIGKYFQVIIDPVPIGCDGIGDGDCTLFLLFTLKKE